MRATDIPKSINHRQHDKAKRQRNAGMSNRAVAGLVDDNRPSAGEDEAKCAEEFSE